MRSENHINKESYENLIVNKPWGYEYLVYENDSMAMWCLHLNKDQQTSMHCHPDKKTGLIAITGEIIVSFLKDSMSLKSLSKLMIRPGLFHSSKAISDNGAILFEFENPVNKENLVRLEDSYGRKEKPYEGRNEMKPISGDTLSLPEIKDNEQKSILFHSIEITIIQTSNFEELCHEAEENELFAILEGSLLSKTGDIILGPADVVSPDIFKKLSSTFSAAKGIKLIRLKQVIRC
jgi:mannose-6-phosphate isomerase-like protein (cupin superfamily)